VLFAYIVVMEKLIKLLEQATKKLDDIEAWESIVGDREFKRFLIELNTLRQLYRRGIDVHGNIIGYYAESTARRKPQKKQGTPYTLEDTGAFYDSFDILSDDDSLQIVADDEIHGFSMFGKFGDVVGFTDESIKDIGREYKTKLIEYVKKILQGD
jgi:hypothetical protein